MPRESLATLRKIVQDLEDRDTDLKRDMSLFEAAFKSFPVPVAIWSTDESGLCESRRVTGATSSGWSGTSSEVLSAVDLYRCPSLKAQLVSRIEQALTGTAQSFVCQGEDACIWTHVQPRRMNEEVVGVVGISVDVTSSFEALAAIRDTLSLPPNSKEEDHVE